MSGADRKPDHEIPAELLPEGFAEQLDRPPTEPAVPRPAATVVLLRRGPGGLEVLLVRRSRRSGFVPGAWVFPGGRVDRADGDPELLGRVDGLDPDAAEARLGAGVGDTPALAYYVAALREAFEETGLLVGRTEDGKDPPPPGSDPEVEALRGELLDDATPFGRVLDRMACRLDGSAVEYVAHWITPEAEPRRYDTRFFAARVPEDREASLDPREMTDAVWIAPAEALARNRAGELPMVFPTLRTLEALADFGSPDEALAHFKGRDIPTVLPRLVRTPTGVGLELPEE